MSELLEEFEKAFKDMKDELKFDSSLDELDDIFFLRDNILNSGYVSPKLSRVVCARIRDTFNLWITTLHNYLIPNTQSMLSVTENEVFDDKEKEQITSIMNRFMAFTSKNIVIGLTKDKEQEAKYIDDSVKLWKENLDKLIKIEKKINKSWEDIVK